MPWQKMLFRNEAVWILVGDDGRPVLDRDGRAEMKYREGDTKSYRPGLANLSLVPGAPSVAPAPVQALKARSGAADKTPREAPADGAVVSRGEAPMAVWTDGACSGNPGPMGIGVVVIRRHRPRGTGRIPGHRHQQHRRAGGHRTGSRSGGEATDDHRATGSHPQRLGLRHRPSGKRMESEGKPGAGGPHPTEACGLPRRGRIRESCRPRGGGRKRALRSTCPLGSRAPRIHRLTIFQVTTLCPAENPLFSRLPPG